MNISNTQLQTWAQAPSATKYIATRNRIEKAVKDKFGSNVDVYLQGSYKNSTHVRSESDVDIIVEYTPAYYPGFLNVSAEEQAIYHRQHTNHDYVFSQFKSDVLSVLEKEFSVGEVKRGEKSIKVLKNESRVNADVIACFTHKRYISATKHDAVGIQFFMDSGDEVVNFPKQHHENGEDKNSDTRTDGKYKDMVRIYKNIRYKLIDAGILADNEIASHFIECLVWNVPDSYFNGAHADILRFVTAKIWTDMKAGKDPHNNYSYIHNLHWLFKQNLVYTPEKAEKFMSKVWSFSGF